MSNEIRFILTARPIPNQFGKFALLAKGVGMIAKVPHNLKQALLCSRAGQDAGLGAAEQTASCQAQHAIILG